MDSKPRRGDIIICYNNPINYFINIKLNTMAGTFSQLYIQLIFAVKGRENLINNTWKTELNKYIAGIIKGKGQKPIIVNGMSDHIHAFVGLKPSMSISDLARDVKNNSSNFINDNKFVKRKFSWQDGYGVFS
jgi:REP element-mobilizing transposase RayT